MENKKRKKVLIVLSIILGICLLAGATYAFIYWRSDDYNISVNTKCFDVYYTKGDNVIEGDLLLLDEANIIDTDNNEVTVLNGMQLTTFASSIDSSCDMKANVEIKLNTDNLDSAFTSEGDSYRALKYVLARINLDDYDNISVEDLAGDSFEILATGSITSENTLTIYNEQLPSDDSERQYLLLVYLDGDLVNNDAGDTYFSLNVEAVAHQIVSSNAQKEVQADINNLRNWFIEQNNNPTSEVFENWLEENGGEFPTCSSADGEDLGECFYIDEAYEGNITDDILSSVGLLYKGIQTNSAHSSAFINEETNKICVVLKLGVGYNAYYGTADENIGFSTDDGYPVIIYSDGCNR